MPFTNRCWGSIAVLLYALLFQNCQLNSVSATEEEELSANASASLMHQCTCRESLAVENLAVVNTASNISESSLLASESNTLEDSKLPAKRKSPDLDDEHSYKKTLNGEEQSAQSGDFLTIFLDVASSHPDKAIQFLEVLLVAVQDKRFRQQALEVLDNVSKASPDMFSECLPSLRAAAQEGDKAVRLLALKTLGEVEWRYYFGEVGPAPDLPKNITQILDAPCPFWPGKPVKDTHLLALIPARVDGKPFTLNLLGELIKFPKRGGSKTKYKYYDNNVKTQLGNNAPASPYWVLLTRDVLPESCYKGYTAQKALVAGHASHTGLHYELPQILEAVTAILVHQVRTGERLYGDDPRTYTRCQELIHYSFGDCPGIVGGFESSGFYVSGSVRHVSSSSGVAGCRKF